MPGNPFPCGAPIQVGERVYVVISGYAAGCDIVVDYSGATADFGGRCSDVP